MNFVALWLLNSTQLIELPLVSDLSVLKLISDEIYMLIIIPADPEDFRGASVRLVPRDVCFFVTIEDDNAFENAETFIATLTTSDPNVIINPPMATVEIQDTDSEDISMHGVCKNYWSSCKVLLYIHTELIFECSGHY